MTKRQYYYKNSDCKAKTARDPDCICWHDEGTGPLLAGLDGEYPVTKMAWRNRPEPVASALSRFNEHMGEDAENDPIERLRFFLSFALRGQDWIDVEQFLDELKQPEPVSVEPVAWKDTCITSDENGVKTSDPVLIGYEGRETLQDGTDIYTGPHPDQSAHIAKLEKALSMFLDSHEECTDFDGFTAQIVSMDDYHAAQEALTNIKEALE